MQHIYQISDFQNTFLDHPCTALTLEEKKKLKQENSSQNIYSDWCKKDKLDHVKNPR